VTIKTGHRALGGAIFQMSTLIPTPTSLAYGSPSVMASMQSVGKHLSSRVHENVSVVVGATIS